MVLLYMVNANYRCSELAPANLKFIFRKSDALCVRNVLSQCKERAQGASSFYTALVSIRIKDLDWLPYNFFWCYTVLPTQVLNRAQRIFSPLNTMNVTGTAHTVSAWRRSNGRTRMIMDDELEALRAASKWTEPWEFCLSFCLWASNGSEEGQSIQDIHTLFTHL